MRTFWRLLACAGMVAGLAGCAAQTTTTPKVTGTHLTIYVSAPSSSAGAQQSDVLDAEELAFAHLGHSIGRYRLSLRVLHGEVSDNARTAIEDSSAIAYIGEVEPGASAGTIGITNAEDLLQVSPTDTALELTRASSAVSGAPSVYYESGGTYGRTFARVVPTTTSEARAQVAEMRSLGVHKVYISDDGSPYGRALAAALRQDVSAPLTAVEGSASASSVSGLASSGADAVFFAGTNAHQATSLFNAVATRQVGRTCAAHTRCGPALLAPSALYSSSFVAGLSPAARSLLYISSPGFLPRDMPAAGRSQFLSRFEATYHHSPAPAAIFGYEAISAVVAVLNQAGASANQRSVVVKDFMHLHRSSSVIGSYSINAYGNPTTAPFVFSRVQGGALVPYRFEQATG